MKKFILFTLTLILSTHTFAYDVSGVATNSETGAPLLEFNILLTYTTGGVASDAVTGADGSFMLSGVVDGIYNLEFYSYPDPIILNGDYFLRTVYPNQIVVNGGNITGVEFQIPPHHPQFTLTGALYDAVTNEQITIQDFQVRMQMQFYVEYFYDNATENGIYIIEDLPDYTYELIIFDNDYYEGVSTEITIDSLGPDTITMDFFLQPKSGVTVTGVLLDSITNQPIMQAGRTIKIQAINSLFTETNSQGEFTFLNVPPGSYANIHVASEDTSYVNCSLSEISGFYVPDTGISNLELYQKPWVSVHELTSDNEFFEPGETKTFRFNIVNDDLVYGGIWGVNLIFPEGVTVNNTTPFYSTQANEVIFDQLPDCSTNEKKAWEGWHFVGIPPYASSEGNLEDLNESAWCDVTLDFADSISREELAVFYEIYYAKHCFSIQPFSYGTIMMENDNFLSIETETSKQKNEIISFPNPASNTVNFTISLDETRKGEILLTDISGNTVMKSKPTVFPAGNTRMEYRIDYLHQGIYFYTFMADDLRLSGKVIISR